MALLARRRLALLAVLAVVAAGSDGAGPVAAADAQVCSKGGSCVEGAEEASLLQLAPSKGGPPTVNIVCWHGSLVVSPDNEHPKTDLRISCDNPKTITDNPYIDTAAAFFVFHKVVRVRCDYSQKVTRINNHEVQLKCQTSGYQEIRSPRFPVEEFRALQMAVLIQQKGKPGGTVAFRCADGVEIPQATEVDKVSTHINCKSEALITEAEPGTNFIYNPNAFVVCDTGSTSLIHGKELEVSCSTSMVIAG